MERDSLLYKARRKCQVLAHKVVSNETMSKLYFKIVLHKKLNLKNPQTFNEKIQWLKLYYYPKNLLVVNGSDKYAVESTFLRRDIMIGWFPCSECGTELKILIGTSYRIDLF